MNKDKIFSKNIKIGDFKFNKEVANVFDDMLTRSVPFYEELQIMVAELVENIYSENSNIYDLGCSTGTAMCNILKRINSNNTQVIGIDYSKNMLDKAEEKIRNNYNKDNYRLILADLNKKIVIQNASVVLLNLTLQFVRPLNRDALIKNIYNNLKKNGCVIIIEKILGDSNFTNRLFIELYYSFKKRKGYSDLEISQKREALENILIPFTIDENKELLRRNGFKTIDTFFKWHNFAGIIGVKEENET